MVTVNNAVVVVCNTDYRFLEDVKRHTTQAATERDGWRQGCQNRQQVGITACLLSVCLSVCLSGFIIVSSCPCSCTLGPQVSAAKLPNPTAENFILFASEN